MQDEKQIEKIQKQYILKHSYEPSLSPPEPLSKAELFKNALNIKSKRPKSLSFGNEDEIDESKTRTRSRSMILESEIETYEKLKDKENNILTDIKLCPGSSCNKNLHISMFLVNTNMKDGYDVYCIKCNEKMRKLKKEKRKNYSKWTNGIIPMASNTFAEFKKYNS